VTGGGERRERKKRSRRRGGGSRVPGSRGGRGKKMFGFIFIGLPLFA